MKFLNFVRPANLPLVFGKKLRIPLLLSQGDETAKALRERNYSQVVQAVGSSRPVNQTHLTGAISCHRSRCPLSEVYVSPNYPRRPSLGDSLRFNCRAKPSSRCFRQPLWGFFRIGRRPE